jgi:bifunctional non-homologous end joining protein LigD
MLATLGTLPTGPGWAYEYKFDGVRAVCYVTAGGDTRVMSRNEHDVTASYPELAAALPRGRQLILDGELVALDAHGHPSFARLQRRMNVHEPTPDLLADVPLTYDVFDVLALDGKPTVALPYEQRRELLTGLDLGEGLIVVPPNFTPGRDGGLDEVLARARAGKLEGVIAKRLDAPYAPGRRSPDWIKAPFIRTQEVLVVGWKAGEGRRAGTIGSLLVAVRDRAGGPLSFAGGVGTGFTDAMLHDLAGRLAPLRRDSAPVDDVPRSFTHGVEWVEPVTVGEVEYRSWTDDGRLRHSSWRGLRPDRRPDEVVAVEPR